MSKFNSSDGRPLPMGILVEVPKKNTRLDRPTPGRQPDSPERQIPWMWIAVGGSVGWVLIVIVLAIMTIRHEGANQPEQRLPQPLAVDGPFEQIAKGPPPLPPARAEALPEIDDDVIDAPQKQVLPKRALRAVKPDEEFPLILKVGNEPKEKIQVLAPAPKEERKKVDLNVYQDCQQIGCDVLFMRNPPEAFKRAKEEKKMVFMVHLSGNLEDQDFT